MEFQGAERFVNADAETGWVEPADRFVHVPNSEVYPTVFVRDQQIAKLHTHRDQSHTAADGDPDYRRRTKLHPEVVENGK